MLSSGKPVEMNEELGKDRRRMERALERPVENESRSRLSPKITKGREKKTTIRSPYLSEITKSVSYE